MRRIFIVLAFSSLSLFSCKKNAGGNSLHGLYTEASPVAGRSQLNFINNNIVIKSETGSSYKDTFNYSFSTGKITLTLVSTPQYPSSFDFLTIDENSFQIQNLYASIPEAPESFMIYKK